jgi:hypothetical protein
VKPVHAVSALVAAAALVVLIARTIREGETLAKYAGRQLRLALG